MGSQLSLMGSQLSIDTTRSAPPQITQGVQANPAYQECENSLPAQEAQCDKLTKSAQAACIKEAEGECAKIPPTVYIDTTYYSYMLFSPTAIQGGAANVFIPLTTIPYGNSDFSFDIDIDYIHATFGSNLSAGLFDAYAPSMWINLADIQSNSPTLNLTNVQWQGSPGVTVGVNMTGLSVQVSLGGFAPTNDHQSIDYQGVVQYDLDLTHWAGVLATWVPGTDVAGDIHAELDPQVKALLNGIFNAQSTHDLISNALKESLQALIGNYSQITALQGTSRGASWTVYYEP